MEINLKYLGAPLKELQSQAEELLNLVNPKEMPFIELPKDEELKAYAKVAERLRETSSQLVIVGIGGSSRGARAINQSIGLDGNKLKFIDNVDPALLSKVLRELRWETSAFLFISKSGKTLETVTALNAILPELQRRGLSLKEKCAFISDEGSPFEELAREVGAPFTPIPKRVGGRFSIFTAVGLIPSLFAGFNVKELLEGAERVIKEPFKAVNLALAKYWAYKKGKRVAVIMPYSSFMGQFTEWYVQLWAESIGKDGKGQTPLKAEGTSSQHAILQLFMDGPDDKVFQIISIKNSPEDITLPREAKILPFIGGKRVSQVMEAELKGTIHALKRRGRPLILLELSRLNEREMGELFMNYMVATVVMGKLLGVNPYGQPAVEIGKKAAIEELLKGEEVRN